MKKILKIATSLCLAFAMSVNVLSLDVFAVDHDANWFVTEFPDENFRKAIAAYLNIEDDSQAKEKIEKWTGMIVIDGLDPDHPEYHLIKDVTGVQHFKTQRSIIVSDALVSEAPKLKEGERVTASLQLQGNAIHDLTSWKGINMRPFDISDQLLIYVDADGNVVKRDEIGDNTPVTIDLNGRLKLLDGMFPYDGLQYNSENGDGEVTWSGLAYTAKSTSADITSHLSDGTSISLNNVKESGTFEANWYASRLQLGEALNPWSGTVLADFTVIYKHDIEIGKDADNRTKGAVNFLKDGSYPGETGQLAYYEYGNQPVLQITPEAGSNGGRRRLQADQSYYINTTDGKQQPLEVKSLGEAYQLSLPDVVDVNHVKAKFTHLPEIQAKGNGSVKVVSSDGEENSVMSGKHVLVEDINDGEHTVFSFDADADNEVKSITVNGIKVYAKDVLDETYVSINAYNKKNNGEDEISSVKSGTVTLNNIQKDDIVVVNFGEIDYYEVTAEVIANHEVSVSDPASTTMDDGMNGGTISVTDPDDGTDGKTSSHIFTGEARTVNVKANDGYRIKSWKVLDLVTGEDVTAEYTIKDHGAISLENIKSDYKVTVQFVAKQDITTEVVKNEQGKGNLDDGLTGGSFTSGNPLTEISRGDNRIVSVVPNRDAKYDAEGKAIGGYLVEKVSVVQMVRNDAGELEEKPVNSGYQILPADQETGTVNVVFDDIRADHKVKASFIATNAIGVEVVGNGLPVNLDQGLDGGTIAVVDQNGKPVDASLVHRGDDRSFKIDANSDYQVHTFKVYKTTGTGNVDITDEVVKAYGDPAGESAYTFELKQIRNDYKVEVSFIAVYEIDVKVIPNQIAEAGDNGMDGMKAFTVTNKTEMLNHGQIYRLDDATVQVVANDQYIIHELYVDGKKVNIDAFTTEQSVSLEAVKENHLVEVSFRKRFNVTTETVGEHKADGGTITESKLNIPDGDAYTVTVKANEGFIINEASLKTSGGTIVSQDRTTAVIEFAHVTKDEHVQAGFTRLIDVTTEIIGEHPDGGTITDSEFDISEHENRMIIIKPNAGYIVDKALLEANGGVVLEDEDGTVSVTFINLTEDKHVVAAFVKVYDITTEIVGEHPDGGFITDSEYKIPEHEDRVITITAKEQYIVDVDQISADGGIVNVQEDGTVTVTFEDLSDNKHVTVPFIRTYNITTEITGKYPDGGTITESEYHIREHEDRVITIKPKEGYIVDEAQLKEDGGVITNNEDGTITVIFKDLTEDKHVTVAFIKTFNVTTEVVGEHKDGGTISESTFGIPENDPHTVVITVKEGFRIDEEALKSTGGTIVKQENGTVTVEFSHMEKDEHVQVGFIRLIDIITENLRPEGGTITESETDIPEHSDREITIKPNEGYIVDEEKLKEDGGIITKNEDGTITVTFEDLTENKHVVVSFIKVYNVTTEVVGEHKDGGTISESTFGIPENDPHTVVITVKEGFRIDEEALKSTGGTIVKQENGTVTVEFPHMEKDEHVQVGFIRLIDVITENLRPEGGTITESETDIPEHSDKVIIIKPNPGYEIDEEKLKEDGGIITKNEDGTITIVFKDLKEDKHVIVSFNKLPEKKPVIEPEQPQTPDTGDQTQALYFIMLAIFSGLAWMFAFKKQKKAKDESLDI